MDYINQHWLTSQTLAGLIHFTTATIGLILGLGILFLKPGSKSHKISGYIFIPILLTVNISVLFVHEMGMTFGPFHFLIPFSLYFLFLGIKPLLTKMTGQKKLKTHIRGMVGAALGLWAAFCAEIVARTPAISKFLLSFGDNTFWVGTIEGFIFVFIFIIIIKKVNKKQFERLGLTPQPASAQIPLRGNCK
jgi:uncharacterized membrane protein